MKYLVNFSRIFVGILFILSGFVKAVDPMGFGYKLEEYFAPDVFNMEFLYGIAMPLAAFFSIFEIILGVFLLLGIFRKFTIWSLLLTIVFFTFLTFYSAYFNKVTDCGCFGDAVALEPWQSFYKDLILLVLIIILFVGQKYIYPILSNKINYTISGIALFISVVIAYLGVFHLPIIDFRPYAIGKNISEGMKSAEELGLKPSEFQIIYTLKNKDTGEVVEITDEEYVNDEKWYKEGTPWEMDTDKIKEKRLSKGYEPPIHDFQFLCDEGDLTDEVLSAPKVVFYVIPFSDKLSSGEISKLNKLTKELESNNIKVIAGVNNDLESAEFDCCYIDQTTLKTIIRSNPGIVVLQNGVVKAKFHYNDFPALKEITDKL